MAIERVLAVGSVSTPGVVPPSSCTWKAIVPVVRLLALGVKTEPRH